MQLWQEWMLMVNELRGACSRRATFFWMIFVLMAMCIRDDLSGVTSFIRALGLKPECYHKMLRLFHSEGINLRKLTTLWISCVIRLCPGLLKINGRIVLLGDGIKIAKAGKRMPGVKLLHQESDNNTKNEYILGHSCQCVSILASALGSFFAIPLACRIHEGFTTVKTKYLTLLDKMVLLLNELSLSLPFYFVADAYYASNVVIKGLLSKNNHLITRVRTNAVAYKRAINSGRIGAGRKKLYGTKLKLNRLFAFKSKFIDIPSPIYGEKDVVIRYYSVKLLWRPIGQEVKFIPVIHPVRGSIMLMTTDLDLEPVDVIKMYSLRFKIELSFKNVILPSALMLIGFGANA